MFELSGYCLPAKIYLVLSLMGVIFGALSEFSMNALLFHVLFVCLWTLLLNWLCSSGLAVLSWALVLFPYVLIVLLFMLMGTGMLYDELVDEEDGGEAEGYSNFQREEEEEEDGKEGMRDIHR